MAEKIRKFPTLKEQFLVLKKQGSSLKRQGSSLKQQGSLLKTLTGQFAELKEQFAGFARGMAKLLDILPTLETKEDAQKKYIETRQEFAKVRAEAQIVKTELQQDIKELAEHTHQLLDSHMGAHKKLDVKYQDHEVRIANLETADRDSDQNQT